MAFSSPQGTQVRWARLAGFLYLFTYVVPITASSILGRYSATGNFASTAHQIALLELRYRFGLSLSLLNPILCILLSMSLYAALKPVNHTLALFGLLFRFAENVLAAAFALLDFVALKGYTSSDISNAFTPQQLSAFTTLLGEAGAIQFHVSMVFLSIGSALFFYLFLKSGYIPKVLSVFSLCACAIFIFVIIAYFYSPQSARPLRFGWAPMGLAEISVGLWLLVKGIHLRELMPETQTATTLSERVAE